MIYWSISWKLGRFNFVESLRRFTLPILDDLKPDLEASLNNEPAAQKVLMHQYRFLASKGSEWLPDIRDVGFRVLYT